MPRILVVDDEPSIVMLACAALKRAGFETVAATSPKEALDKWSPEIDLLLTDCVMPELFGDQLALRLKERKPSLKVLFMSGNPPGSLELSVPLESEVNFVQKPFDFATLVATVRQTLNESAAPLGMPQRETIQRRV